MSTPTLQRWGTIVLNILCVIQEKNEQVKVHDTLKVQIISLEILLPGQVIDCCSYSMVYFCFCSFV